jgi:hypothetical protein
LVIVVSLAFVCKDFTQLRKNRYLLHGARGECLIEDVADHVLAGYWTLLAPDQIPKCFAEPAVVLLLVQSDHLQHRPDETARMRRLVG